jgi:hypothetical protein
VTDVWLAIIAVAVVVMAAIQVGAIVLGLRLAKRVEQLSTQLETEMRPLVQNLNGIAEEAQRAVRLATAQVERADRLFGDLAVSAERTLAVAAQVVGGPAQKGMALFSAAKVALAAFRELRESSRRRQADRAVMQEDDESLFIG